MRAPLLCLLAAAACTKPAPSPAPPPPLAAAPSPFELVPPGEGVLSVLEPVEQQCRWLRLDVATTRSATVAAFPGPCVGARVGFDAAATKALVWFDPSTVYQQGLAGPAVPPPGHPAEGAGAGAARLFLVDAAKGTSVEVPWPAARGAVHEAGLGPDGAPRALSLESPTDAQRAAGVVDVDGEKVQLALEQEGLPAVAHAYRFADGGWRRVESKATDEGWDLARGVRALDAFAALGPRSDALLEAHFGGEEVDEAAAKVLEEKTGKHPTPEDGEWRRGTTPAGPFFVWMTNVEFAWSTGLLRLADGAPPPDLGFTEGDLVGLGSRGPYLLVASTRAGAFPRAYELRGRTLVYRSDTARAAVFWPAPTQAKAKAAGSGR